MLYSFAQRSRRATTLQSQEETSASEEQTPSEEQPVRRTQVVILGTGFSGLGMAIRLKQQKMHDFVIIERANDIGGTWRDNTYPGCACDIQSHLYSFSFALNSQWSRTYASQREIQTYLRRCARRFGLLSHICWNSELLDASWNDEEICWEITTSRGKILANVLILGNGPLSEPSLPAIPGIEQFEGGIFHSARWRHDYDLTGKRVAVIGTGASAIQFVPQIQPAVAHLTIFQRTPAWILPRMDQSVERWKQRLFWLFPPAQRMIRARMYWQHELTALGMVYRPQALEAGTQLAQRHLARQITTPELRAKLLPDYALGCKRVLLSDDFYPALTQPNVELVTEHIGTIQPRGIVTTDGQFHEVDTIICGTGFHVTDAQLPAHIRGRSGKHLAESWQAGPQAYLGTSVVGFPNLFLLIGPNTGLGHSSMVYMIESQLAYIVDALRKMRQKRLRAIEICPEIQEEYNAEIQRRMRGTVWNSGCNSWYLDARGRNTAIWPGFTFEFRWRTRSFDLQHYRQIH